jgi:cellulose synthase/poly-beta-1,6-N-acetylglucosamine synthase-like glycosyltransferase
MLELIFLICVAGYFIQIIFFFIGAGRKFEKISDEDLPKVTVVVAARNEEENIIRCLDSLERLIYPEEKIQIILVDDNSTDNTGKLIDEFIKDKKKFSKIETRQEIGILKGKTNALATAIAIASGEIILTTDADCAVSAAWAKTIASYYKDDVGVVNGYTTQEITGGFSGMQAIDFIFLLTVAAGTINLNVPITCIGNNMSYRKKSYDEVGGYENLPFSVTEDFNILNAIHKLGKYKLVYPLDKEALVSSLTCRDLISLFRQKKRWAVGGVKVPPVGYIVFAFGFFTHVFILLTPLFFSMTWLYLVMFKLFTDFFFLYHVHNVLGLKKNLFYFFHFEIYYLIYVIILPFIVAINRKVIWKDRKF